MKVPPSVSLSGVAVFRLPEWHLYDVLVKILPPSVPWSGLEVLQCVTNTIFRPEYKYIWVDIVRQIWIYLGWHFLVNMNIFGSPFLDKYQHENIPVYPKRPNMNMNTIIGTDIWFYKYINEYYHINFLLNDMFMYVKAVKVSKLYNVWYLVSKNLKEIRNCIIWFNVFWQIAQRA